MNKIIKYSLAAVLSIGISNTGFAGIIANDSSNSDVGNVDNFIAEDDKVNGEAAELAWVNEQLGLTDPDTATFTIKQNTVQYFSTDTTDVYAFAFDPLPGDDYFLIKNATRIALYQNVDNLDWGVFDINDFDSDAINLPTSPFEISHVSRFNAPDSPPIIPPTVTPEPGLVALFGLGLLSFSLSNIRKKQKS